MIGDLMAKLCLTLATPWTVTHPSPLPMGFPRQEYCTWLPFPPPGNIPNPRIKHESLGLQVNPLPTEPPGNIYILKP